MARIDYLDLHKMTAEEQVAFWRERFEDERRRADRLRDNWQAFANRSPLGALLLWLWAIAATVIAVLT